MSDLNLIERIQFKYLEAVNQSRINNIATMVNRRESNLSGKDSVVFFNATTRIISTSQSAAFAQLSAWGLRMAGVPVKHFVCREGMSMCVLGTDENDYEKEMPCEKCIETSKKIYKGADTKWFNYSANNELDQKLAGMSIDQLKNFIFKNIPLGEIALPSMRWRFRRHHLLDDRPTRNVYRGFIKSAFNIVKKFLSFLDDVAPRLVIVFNGQTYPEAAAKYAAKLRGIPVVTHETGVMPFTAFFTTGEATAYPIDIPDSFILNDVQNYQLDEYLSQRLQGQFSMAGVKFWPEMQELDQEFLSKVKQHKQVIPIFTNVIFDTSQHHANVVFEHMFEWLDAVKIIVEENPETLFVLRAHPDENRKGKAATESVGQWVAESGFDKLPNTVFFPSTEYISSYALVELSKFVMIYNSSIGLESVLMGKPVLAAGKARFSGYPIIYFPKNTREYEKKLNEFLKADSIELPEEFVKNARIFLYYQLFKTSIPFGEFVKPHKLQGYVFLKNFSVNKLSIEKSQTIRTIYESVINNPTFLYEEN